MRGYMDASRYKDYMLEVMFYKLLSEKTLEGYRRATRLQGTDEGTMAIVLPHGELFRGAAERSIRQKLIEKNFIDTIIVLLANLFTNTGMLVVHSARANPENILNVEELIYGMTTKGQPPQWQNLPTPCQHG